MKIAGLPIAAERETPEPKDGKLSPQDIPCSSARLNPLSPSIK